MIFEFARTLSGALVLQIIFIAIAIALRDKKKKMLIVLTVGTIISGIVGFSPQIAEGFEDFLRSIPTVVPVRREASAPTIEPALTPTHTQVSLGTLEIPGNAEQGIKLTVSLPGRYVLTYAGGAYSPWPGADPAQPQWRTRIVRLSGNSDHTIPQMTLLWCIWSPGIRTVSLETTKSLRRRRQ